MPGAYGDGVCLYCKKFIIVYYGVGFLEIGFIVKTKKYVQLVSNPNQFAANATL